MPETFTAYRAGGRSRTVQNIGTDAVGHAKPEQIAYTITEATSAPTAATDGFKNIGLQKIQEKKEIYLQEVKKYIKEVLDGQKSNWRNELTDA